MTRKSANHLNPEYEALEQAMKPIEKISDIRIFNAGGFGGLGGTNGHRSDGNAVSDLSSQLLNFTAQKPILDEILSQAGFKGADPTQALLAASVGGVKTEPAKSSAAATNSHARKDVHSQKEEGLPG